jgi:hypothetical protein
MLVKKHPLNKLTSELIMPVKVDEFVLSLPFGLGRAKFVNNDAQKLAAWELYVEYSTRISTQKLEKNQGSIRQALGSLHSLFATTRSVLRDKGPDTVNSKNSVGIIAINVLNQGVRPFLVKWHTMILTYDNDQQMSLHQDPDYYIDQSLMQWQYRAQFYTELESFRQEMLVYVEILALIANISIYLNETD